MPSTKAEPIREEKDSRLVIEAGKKSGGMKWTS